jgi:hypothetical protein
MKAMTIILSNALTELVSSAGNWDEQKKVETFQESLEELSRKGELPLCEITLDIKESRNYYGLIAYLENVNVSLFERGFRQTTVESFKVTTPYSIKEVRNKILKSLLTNSAVVPAELVKWLKFEPLVFGLDKNFVHGLAPGHYSGEMLIVKKGLFARTPCYPMPIKDTEGWESAFIDGTYVYKTPSSWSASLVSREDEDKAEAKAEADASIQQIEKAQQYVGWTISAIASGIVTLTSPTGEVTQLTSRHSVWNYGDNSEDWIDIGGISI